MGLFKSLGKLAWAGLKAAGHFAGKASEAIERQTDKWAESIDAVTDDINHQLKEEKNKTKEE